MWAFRTACKVSTGLTPFILVYGLEAVVPMEFIIPSLRVAISKKLSLEESVVHRLDQLRTLEEDRFHSAYVATVIQNRRAAWLNKNLKKKVFREGDSVLLYSSRLGKFPGKLKLRYTGP